MNIKIIAATIAVAALVSGCKFVSVSPKLSGDLENNVKELIANSRGDKAAEDCVTNDYPVGDSISKIVIDGAGDMDFSIGAPSLTISAPVRIANHLKITEEGNSLCIGTDGTRIINWENVDITMSLPSLSCLECNGAIDFEAGNLDCGGDLSIELNGAGDIDIDNLTVGKLRIEINGAGDIDLEGTAASAYIEVNGVGDVDITGLICDDIKTEKNGIGRIRK